MRARISNMYQALMWACCLSSVACAIDPVTSTVWRQLTSDLVVTFNDISSPEAGGYLRTKRAKSRVECVVLCTRHPDCFSIAFDPTSGDCDLQPDLSNYQTQPSDLGQVWAKKDSTCHTDDALISNGIVEWDHTLTSPRWNVTCNEEFMKTTDDVSVTCMAGGSWLREGECVRHVWTHPSLSIFPLAVPVPVIDGWTVCVEGRPTRATKFFVRLMVGPSNLALNAGFRTHYQTDNNTIVTNYKLDSAFTEESKTLMDPFPFSVGTPFRMKIKATSSNTFELYVDDVLLLTRPQHASVPASDVTAVHIREDVYITRVDLWC